MLGLKLNHVSKRGHRGQFFVEAMIRNIMQPYMHSLEVMYNDNMLHLYINSYIASSDYSNCNFVIW